MNQKNAPLLRIDVIKTFEIGNIFTKKEGESLTLAIGVYGKGDEGILEQITGYIAKELGISKMAGTTKTIGSTVTTEIKLGEIIADLPEPQLYEDVLATPARDIVYKKISLYPFALRDIAVFVPPNRNGRDVVSTITEKAGNLLACEPQLFDRYDKKNKETGEIEKTSYAFRLVFQSQEKTLSDGEINVIMEAITKALNDNPGWQVR